MQRYYFATGDTVKLSVSVMGIVTHEKRVVSRIDANGVWLGNGPGNRESGPFSPAGGEWLNNGVVFGSTQWIEPVIQEDE